MKPKPFYSCDLKTCEHYRPYHIQDRDRFVEVFHERLLWCLTCDRFKGVNRYEAKRKAGRPRKVQA